jgi:hypothetical protein
LLLLLAILSVGCLGPSAIRHTRLKYNEVFRETNDEQLLLNIVRLRYADTPVFMDLPNITGQFEGVAHGGYNSPVDGAIDPGIPGFGVGQLGLRDTPTLSYHPRQGHEVAQTLVQPINVEAMRVISPGADTLHFLLMAVNEVNDVPNAPLACSLVPRVGQDNQDFRILAEQFVAIQERGAFDLSIALFQGEPSAALPLEQVNGQALLEAARSGYEFRVDGDRASILGETKSLVLRIREGERSAPDVVELTRRLGLPDGRALYRIESEQRVVEESSDLLPDALDERDGIVVNMRSILDIMTFLSKGVCVPSEHVSSGVAPVTPGLGGRAHDWSGLTAGLFCVRSSKHRPKGADTAVPYRGFWYYIDERDVASRTTLSILELLLELQEVESESRGPLLTLPL